jgi:heterodisulfide reductase subunit A
LQESSTQRQPAKSGAVVIVGAGIGGMQAALDLADGGFLVHLVTRESSVGGTMAMLDKTFPTGDCAMCMISPRMVEIGRHPNVRLHTLAEVTAVEGEPGAFRLTVRRQPRYVDQDKCTGCGICETKCPHKVAAEFDGGLRQRKAIYSLLPQAVPHTRVIDREHCLFLQKGRCRACEKYCDAGAVNFADMVSEYRIDAGAVILTPGLARYNPAVRQELGFGRWKNVVTSIQFERTLSASGPFQGEIKRPSDDTHPKRIAWIQCVGSRDPHNANPWCSSVCCMYATKQAVVAKEHDWRIEASIFYMDLRTFGKDFDKYVARAQDEYQVQYHRAMISEVQEEPGTGNLIINWTDQAGRPVQSTFDLVVLSVGLEPQPEAKSLARIFGIDADRFGFAATSWMAPVELSRPGIFVAGTYQGPKDIPETVVQGSAAAAKVMEFQRERRVRDVTPTTLPPETEDGGEARIGVFVCHCGTNIAQTVDVAKVAERAGGLPGVAHTQTLLYACAPDGQERIKDVIRHKGLNRVVVASCTPRTHQPLFQQTIREAGLNEYLFELADIREQCSWCHLGRKEEATEKAQDIVRMNVAKARLLTPIRTEAIGVTGAALVIGGGLAGMTAALSLAEQGFQVHIVERQQQLGGLAAKVYRALDGSEVQAFVYERIIAVHAHPKITIHQAAEVAKTEGFVGNFRTTLDNGTVIEHGAILITSGGTEYVPTEYGFGEDAGVMTQRELGRRLTENGLKARDRFVMIQCVGSREQPFNYCSRICCQDAVKNAIAIKERSRATQVVILYRDMRTYGLREEYYQRARDLGVLFVRYEPDEKPMVHRNEEGLSVTVRDQLLDRELVIGADYVVLSTGLRPHDANGELGKLYKLTRNEDGYFLEAHVKLRPVDFPSEGIFVAGLAHGPKNLDETIAQAQAAAGRAGMLLSHESLSASGIIARHDRQKCMSCLACVRACPFDATYIDQDGRVSHNEIKCTGCGICAGICPAKAFQVNNFKDGQINGMIDALLEETV